MILRGWLDECEAAWWGWRVGGWQGVEYKARGCMRKQTARLSFHASFYANANDMEGGGEREVCLIPAFVSLLLSTVLQMQVGDGAHALAALCFVVVEAIRVAHWSPSAVTRTTLARPFPPTYCVHDLCCSDAGADFFFYLLQRLHSLQEGNSPSIFVNAEQKQTRV